MMTSHCRNTCRAGRVSPVLLLACTLTVLATGPPVPADTEAGATLWGAVLAPDGSRLPGAVITLARREGGEARVVAGALGDYRASDLAPGT